MITAVLVGVLSHEAHLVQGGCYWTGFFRIYEQGRATGLRLYRDGTYLGEVSLAMPTDPMRGGDSLTVTLWDGDPAMSEELRQALTLAA